MRVGLAVVLLAAIGVIGKEVSGIHRDRRLANTELPSQVVGEAVGDVADSSPADVDGELEQPPQVGGDRGAEEGGGLEPKRGMKSGQEVATVGSPFPISSSAYCHAGTMANGQQTYDGAAASNAFSFGTKLQILTGPLAGKVVTITDRHHTRYSFLLDVFVASCQQALNYGRRTVEAVRV